MEKRDNQRSLRIYEKGQETLSSLSTQMSIDEMESLTPQEKHAIIVKVAMVADVDMDDAFNIDQSLAIIGKKKKATTAEYKKN